MGETVGIHLLIPIDKLISAPIEAAQGHRLSMQATSTHSSNYNQRPPISKKRKVLSSEREPTILKFVIRHVVNPPRALLPTRKAESTPVAKPPPADRHHQLQPHLEPSRTNTHPRHNPHAALHPTHNRHNGRRTRRHASPLLRNPFRARKRAQWLTKRNSSPQGSRHHKMEQYVARTLRTCIGPLSALCVVGAGIWTEHSVEGEGIAEP